MIQIYIKHFKEKLQLLPIELLFLLFFFNFPFRIQYADDPDPQPWIKWSLLTWGMFPGYVTLQTWLLVKPQPTIGARVLSWPQ